MAGKYVLGATGGIISYIAGNYLIDRQSSTPLPVSYEQKARIDVKGVDMLPVMSAIFKSLPESTRRNILLKGQKPSKEIVPDWYDVTGENPYKIKEVVPGKVWSVEYSTENFHTFDPSAKAAQKALGMDFSDEQTCWRLMRNAEQFGREISDKTLKDLEKLREVNALIEEKGKCEETLKAVGPVKLYMPVVKLNNGDVLLYCPVRVRDETGFAEWLEGIGPVKWVVVGSSAHTLMIPSVIKRYPEATYISSKDAWDKLAFMDGWPKKKADFEYDNEEDLERLNNLLCEEGIQFHFVKGDNATMTVLPIAHKAALECDIVYSTSNGGIFDLTAEDVGPGGSPLDYNQRLFRIALAAKPTSPNGYLPIYRFWMMDPTCPMGGLFPTPPPKDGSNCTEMAKSLRSILSEEIEHGLGVHTGPLTGKVFRESVDANWNWLDGHSLLQPKKE
jgi:hypothetical protein